MARYEVGQESVRGYPVLRGGFIVEWFKAQEDAEQYVALMDPRTPTVAQEPAKPARKG